MRADLHLHTAASDGVRPPAAMVREAALAGMDVIAVTDHDTTAGLAEALAAAAREGVRVLPGLELNVGGEEEIHLLGYGVRPDDAALGALLDGLLAERRARMGEMLRLLEKMGMPVPPGEVASADGRFMGRLNLASAMVARGYCATVREAVDRYLGAGRPAYVPRRRIGVPEGVRRLRALGAAVCLAHPGRLRMGDETMLARLPGWIEAGLDGLEAYHASHREADALRYDRLARGRGLLVTGGSDCHGRAGTRIGDGVRSWRTARADVEALEERITNVGHG